MFTTGIEHLLGAHIVAGKKAQRAGLFAQPSRDGVLGIQAGLLDRLNMRGITGEL
jgi:hypothetical protein